MRWRERLANYQFKLKHIKTKENLVADALSRMPNTTMQLANEFKEIAVNSVEENKLVLTNELVRMIEGQEPVNNDIDLEPFKRVKNKLQLKNERVYYKDRMIPERFELKNILNDAHYIHTGLTRSLSSVRSLFWWP